MLKKFKFYEKFRKKFTKKILKECGIFYFDEKKNIYR